jgi:probable blue pigment (indigoidine) exporter
MAEGEAVLGADDGAPAGEGTRLRDSLITAIAPLAWGTTYLVTTEFLPPDRPLLLSALRALPVGLLFLVLKRHWLSGIWWWRAFALSVLNISASFTLLFLAAYRLPGGVAGTMTSTQPLVVVLLAWLVLGEQPKRAKSLAAGAGVIGVALLILTPDVRLDALGLLAALLHPFINGLGTVYTQRWVRPVPLLTFTGWQLTLGGLTMIPFALAFEGPLPTFTPTHLAGLAYMGLVATGLAYFVWFRGIERISASAAAFLILLIPVIATAIDSLVLHRHLGPLQLLGAAIVLVSVFVAERSSAVGRRRREASGSERA